MRDRRVCRDSGERGWECVDSFGLSRVAPATTELGIENQLDGGLKTDMTGRSSAL